MLKRGLVLVVALFSLDLAVLGSGSLSHYPVLYILSLVGGPISGSLHGIIKELGSSITITAAGVFGAFLVIFAVSVAGLLYFTR